MTQRIPGVIPGVILAGGQARRMGGGDKPLQMLGGRPLLAHVIDRLAPQVAALAVNANGNPARFAAFGLPVIADSVADSPGPLAGILAAMDWARWLDPSLPAVVTVPGDAPFLPRDLVARLAAARGTGADRIACAVSGGRVHPVAGLWPVGLRDDLRRALEDEGLRKVTDFTMRYRPALAEFDAVPVDPFLNVNTPADLAEAGRLVAAAP